jgi:hypothetical protein
MYSSPQLPLPPLSCTRLFYPCRLYFTYPLLLAVPSAPVCSSGLRSPCLILSDDLDGLRSKDGNTSFQPPRPSTIIFHPHRHSQLPLTPIPSETVYRRPYLPQPTGITLPSSYHSSLHDYPGRLEKTPLSPVISPSPFVSTWKPGTRSEPRFCRQRRIPPRCVRTRRSPTSRTGCNRHHYLIVGSFKLRGHNIAALSPRGWPPVLPIRLLVRWRTALSTVWLYWSRTPNYSRRPSALEQQPGWKNWTEIRSRT